MAPFVYLIDMILNVVEIVIILWIILSILVSFNIVNRHQPFVSRVMFALDRLIDPLLRPIRKYMPFLVTGGLDLSPIVLFIAIKFIRFSMLHYLL